MRAGWVRISLRRAYICAARAPAPRSHSGRLLTFVPVLTQCCQVPPVSSDSFDSVHLPPTLHLVDPSVLACSPPNHHVVAAYTHTHTPSLHRFSHTYTHVYPPFPVNPLTHTPSRTHSHTRTPPPHTHPPPPPPPHTPNPPCPTHTHPAPPPHTHAHTSTHATH